MIAPTEITQHRDISFNESAVLAKEAEEVILYRDMQSDIVRQIAASGGLDSEPVSAAVRA